MITDQSISNNQSSAETIDGDSDNSDEQEERRETEIITLDSNLLELVNNLFT